MPPDPSTLRIGKHALWQYWRPCISQKFYSMVGISAYQRGSFDTHLSPQQPEGSCLQLLTHLYQILPVTLHYLYDSCHNRIWVDQEANLGHPHAPHSVFYVTVEVDIVQVYNQLQKVLGYQVYIPQQ